MTKRATTKESIKFLKHVFLCSPETGKRLRITNITSKFGLLIITCSNSKENYIFTIQIIEGD